MRRSRGWSALELLVVLALVGLVSTVVLPSLAEMRQGDRARAAARELGTRLAALRWQAVATGRSHGLLFSRDGRGWSWVVVRDGNGNGLRSAEIRAGTDLTLSAPRRLEDQVAGVRLGFPGGAGFPEIPPRSGTIADLDDPIQFGRSDLVSFSPLGSASSGTLYLTDGDRRLVGVVLFGPTVRLRVWTLDTRVGRWTL